jgi:hypothetical protein
MSGARNTPVSAFGDCTRGRDYLTDFAAPLAFDRARVEACLTLERALMLATFPDPLARSAARRAPDLVRSTLEAALPLARSALEAALPLARCVAPRTWSLRLPVALPTTFLAEPTA